MTGSYEELKRRIRNRLEEKQYARKFIDQMMEGFEMTLADEKIVLSRPERTRLFKRILWEVLTDLIEEHT